MKERNYSLDLMRIFLCLCVIALHSFSNFGCDNYLLETIVMAIFGAANGLFYMLSGYFNLEREFKDSKDIKNYYKSRFIDVVVPFLVFVLFWLVWDLLHSGWKFNLFELIASFYSEVLDTGALGHLWFMYPLFGLLLAAPFLSIMLHHMDDKQVKMLWLLAIGFGVVRYFLCENFDIGFNVSDFFMEGWIIYFIGGYYYRHVASKEGKLKWSILCIASFVLTICGIVGVFSFFNNFADATNFQPLFIIFCLGYMYVWDKGIKINNVKAQKVILFLSKNTYLIYLFHMRGIEFATRKLPVMEPGLGYGLLILLGSFIISLIFAYLTNLLLKPIKLFLNKVIKVK